MVHLPLLADLDILLNFELKLVLFLVLLVLLLAVFQTLVVKVLEVLLGEFLVQLGVSVVHEPDLFGREQVVVVDWPVVVDQEYRELLREDQG